MSAAAWTRETPWRQGHVLPQEAMEALGLAFKPEEGHCCGVVVSHDCDIAQDNLEVEPHVEVIVGAAGVGKDGSYLYGRVPRTLHIEYSLYGAPTWIELVATRKTFVPKQELVKFVPDTRYCLLPRNRAVLRDWLAARYRRAAFDDAFERLMKDSKAVEQFSKVIGKKYGDIISAVYFDIDGGEPLDHSDGSPYQVAIVLSYPEGDEPDNAAMLAEKAAKELESALAVRLFDAKSNRWNGIQILECYPVAEETFPVATAKTLSEWPLGYISHRDDPPQPQGYAR